MSAEDLQLQKLTREVEKLQLDIDNLKRPVLAYWRNPASYLTAAGDVAVPDVEIVGDKVNGLKATELRYFWDADRAEAESFAKKIEATGKYGAVALVLPSHLKGKTRPRHFELWIKRPG